MKNVFIKKKSKMMMHDYIIFLGLKKHFQHYCLGHL